MQAGLPWSSMSSDSVSGGMPAKWVPVIIGFQPNSSSKNHQQLMQKANSFERNVIN